MSGRQSPQAGEQKALPPVVVKKYANRRLYNTETSAYVTLDDLAAMVKDGRDFVVYDAKTGEDITRSGAEHAAHHRTAAVDRALRR